MRKDLKKGTRAYADVMWGLYRQRIREGVSMAAALREIGYSKTNLEYARKHRAGFRKEELAALAIARGAGPPETGGLKVFRENYLNVPSFNPYTGKTAHVGVTYPYMEQVIEAIESPEPLVMILLPVRFAKTTILEQKSVEILSSNPNGRIIWICSNVKHIYERSYNIQRVMLDQETYPELHDKWGPWLGKPDDSNLSWTKTSFYIRGRSSPERSPSVSGYGINAKVYGARADWIFLDDVDDPENGQDVRDQIVRNIQGPIMSRLTEGGRIRYIGTRVGLLDVPSRLMASGMWKVIQMSAEVDGESLCPEMYTFEDLQLMRAQMGESTYQMMLLNNPAPEGSMMFPPQLLDNAKGSFDDAPSDWDFWTGLDPATSGRAAIVTVAYNENNHEMRVVDCEVRVNPRHDGLSDMVSAQLARWRSKYVVIEAQGGSSLFSDVPAVRSLIYDAGARVVEFQTTGSNKHDHQFGVPLLATEMERGRLRIANGVAAAPRMKPLLTDLMAWTPHKTNRARYDCVDALWFVVNSLATKRKPQGTKRIYKPGWMRMRRAG